MSRPRTISAELIAKIRELRAAGFSRVHIAAECKVSLETVDRYSSKRSEERITKTQRKQYEKRKQDPETVERYRSYAREYARRKRAEAKANGVLTKRELAAQLRAKREMARVDAGQLIANSVGRDQLIAHKLPGTERECVVCGAKFRTIYRNVTCSREHATEHKKQYLKRWRASRELGLGLADGVGFLSMGPAGGGHRVGQQHGD